MKTPRLIAFLDVDNFLLDFNTAAVAHIKERYGINIPDDYKPKTWGFSETGAPPEWFATMPEDWVSRLKPFENAPNFTHQLAGRDVRVVLVTKVPVERTVDRIHNMAEHGFHWDEMLAVHGHHKKSAYINATLKRFPDVPWVFGDDSAEQGLDVVENCEGGHVVVLDTFYNQGLDTSRMLVLEDHHEAYHHILNMNRFRSSEAV